MIVAPDDATERESYSELLPEEYLINKKAKVKMCKDFLKIIQSIKNDTTLTTI